MSKLHPVIFNDFHSASVSVREPIPDEMIKWLDETSPAFTLEPVCGKYSMDVMYNIISFTDEKDLMMFRLKWA